MLQAVRPSLALQHAATATPVCSAIKNDGGYDSVVRPVERVDGAVHEDVLIMKVSKRFRVQRSDNTLGK